MKLGGRITAITVTVVLVTLGLYGLVTLRARRVELATDLERQTGLVGSAVQVAFEAALQEGLFEDVGSLIRRWQAKEPAIAMSYIDLSHWQPGKVPPAFQAGQPGSTPDGGTDSAFVTPPPDPTRTERLTRLDIEGQTIGAHVQIDGRPVYVLTLPIRDSNKRIVAAVELTRDESESEASFTRALKTALWAMLVLVVGLGLLVWLSARAAITRLQRLVEAIDDVAQGDLGRVILGGDDEVGELADRFNQMTGNLREARGEILAGVDAKLALEARLRHSEKLATIGQLAAGIAHEVGTPLNVIGGRARTMEKRALAEVSGEGAPLNAADVAKNAAIIATQTQRITRIIQQLLDYARRPAIERRTVDVGEVVRTALDFLEHQLQLHRVESVVQPFVNQESGLTTPLVNADPDQLQQVCLNLCLNAIQAMPDGGRLELRTRGVIRRRPGLETASPGPYVVLEVADTGPGIPDGDRERIFEPFYSTKAEEGGTGLGLSVSVGIIKDHDGWIDIDVPSTGGTVFRVFLPALEPSVAPRDGDGDGVVVAGVI